MKTLGARLGSLFLAFAVAGVTGCRADVWTLPRPAPAAPAAPPAAPAPPAATPAVAAVTRTGYTVQVGAFSILKNAEKLAASLNAMGLDAYYYRQESGLYRVRFGDFASKDSAFHEAERLRGLSVIRDYFIIRPEDHPVFRPDTSGDRLRDHLAATAKSYLGVEYAWGGTTSHGGFDCSGLVRAVYQLNGLSLPRSVGDQYYAGREVSRDALLKGDLVFFSASPGGALSHVGICVGNDTFIHAPGTGKTVREDSLDSSYFREHFAGARSYLK